VVLLAERHLASRFDVAASGVPGYGAARVVLSQISVVFDALAQRAFDFPVRAATLGVKTAHVLDMFHKSGEIFEVAPEFVDLRGRRFDADRFFYALHATDSRKTYAGRAARGVLTGSSKWRFEQGMRQPGARVMRLDQARTCP